ncbi:MAG: YaiI/YqxD family protein [Candidatus Howiella sp.]
MRVLIDADGCPVVDITLQTCTAAGVECLILCDTAHELAREGARTITVSKGVDSVDFALVNLLQAGDVAVTQDYGLAAMCLAKGARALDQNGRIYDDRNIAALLEARHIAKKIRRAGGRLKGPAKRTSAQDENFRSALQNMLGL